MCKILSTSPQASEAPVWAEPRQAEIYCFCRQIPFPWGQSKFTSREGMGTIPSRMISEKLSLWKPGEEETLVIRGTYNWGQWREKTLLITDRDYWWTKQLLISNHDSSRTEEPSLHRHKHTGTEVQVKTHRYKFKAYIQNNQRFQRDFRKTCKL